MKTEIIQEQETRTEIDWSVVQLVKSGHSPLVVLTSGEYYEGDFFEASVIIADNSYQIGRISKTWSKVAFMPVTKTVTIQFTP